MINHEYSDFVAHAHAVIFPSWDMGVCEKSCLNFSSKFGSRIGVSNLIRYPVHGLFDQALVVLDLLFKIDVRFSSAPESLLSIASMPISTKISHFVNRCSGVQTKPQPSWLPALRGHAGFGSRQEVPSLTGRDRYDGGPSLVGGLQQREDEHQEGKDAL